LKKPHQKNSSQQSQLCNPQKQILESDYGLLIIASSFVLLGGFGSLLALIMNPTLTSFSVQVTGIASIKGERNSQGVVLPRNNAESTRQTAEYPEIYINNTNTNINDNPVSSQSNNDQSVKEKSAYRNNLDYSGNCPDYKDKLDYSQNCPDYKDKLDYSQNCPDYSKK